MQRAELPFYEYSIDLYGFAPRKDTTIAFELKLYDWRRALQQALLYQLCSDFVYIAMPENSAHRVNLSELQAHGIGLIAVRNSGDCICVVEASVHTEVRQFYRCTHISYLKETTNA